MSETEAEWVIPTYAAYDSFSKVAKALLHKNADRNSVSVKEISELSSISKPPVGSILLFFKTIGVLELLPDGYKLTKSGVDYVTALSMDTPEDIKKHSIQLIENSHLLDLKKFIDLHHDDLDLDKLYKFIKTKARVQDGSRAGNMPPAESTGATCLLHIFKNAGLISNSLLDTIKPKGELKKPQKEKQDNTTRAQFKGSGPRAGTVADSESWSSNGNSFSLSISKNIDPEEFEYLKSHIPSFLDFIEKRLSNQNKNQP